jgi:acyl carrier protein phosphodiesterase
MNFLAHLYLAGNDEDLIVGNFIADSVKGNKYKTYPDRIGKGILMHREVDYFSDNNPTYLQSVHRLQPTCGKYSGVITDMFYDYFLANNWNRFSTTGVDLFCKEMYRILSSRKNDMPEESRIILDYMIKRDWLYSYSKIEGIRRALEGMSHRMKYYFPMDKAALELEKNPSPYNNDFLDFFPLIINHIKSYKLSEP